MILFLVLLFCFLKVSKIWYCIGPSISLSYALGKTVKDDFFYNSLLLIQLIAGHDSYIF